jgi:adenylosuccinate lyase
MRTWKGDLSFAGNAKQEPEITALISPEQIDQLCSLEMHFRHVEETFAALGL